MQKTLLLTIQKQKSEVNNQKYIRKVLPHEDVENIIRDPLTLPAK